MDAHKQEVFKTLAEFGFEDFKIQAAWDRADIKTVEGLVEYIEKHDIQPPTGAPAESAPAPTGEAKPDPSTFVQNIGHLVKKELVDELKSQGYSQIVAEKAVLLSGNKDLPQALNWIMQNQDSPDFNDPIQVEAGPAKPALDPEEAKLKAIELQKEIRRKILEKEKADAIASEKLRVQMTKDMIETKRLMDEQRQKQDMDEFLRQKRKDEQDKAEMLRIMEEDKIRRFGKVPEKVEKVKSTQEKFQELYGKLYKAYRLGQVEVLKGLLGMVRLYLDNIVKNPTDERFRKIRSSNAKFVEKVKDVVGGVPLVQLAGFVDEGEFFVLHHPDLAQVTEIRDLIDAELLKIS